MKAAEKADNSVFQSDLFGKLGVYIVNEISEAKLPSFYIKPEREKHSQIGPPTPSRRTTELILLKFGTRVSKLLCYSSMNTEPRRDPQSRAISTGSDLDRPP